MKWIFLFLVLLFGAGLTAALRSNRRLVVPTCFLLGISAVLLSTTLWTSVYGWDGWPSPVMGVDVSIVDAIAVALLFAGGRVRIPLSIKLSFALICFAVLISVAIAYVRIPALFVVWQLLRMTILFVAVARICASHRGALTALVVGLMVGMAYEPVMVVMQHLEGAERPGGSFGHSNGLGIVSDFIIPPAVTLMLGGRRWFLPALTVLAGGVCAVLGESRASLGLFGIGVVAAVLLSIMHRRSSRKFAFAGLLAVLLLTAAPIVIWSAGQRSEQSLASSDYERSAMKEAARMMIADHPFGVGANQYSFVANAGGYAERAGVAWNYGNRRAPVHNTYYLVTAEMGFIGLLGLLALLGSTILLGMRCMRHHLPGDDGELIPGLLASMIILPIHIAYEFAFMDPNIEYLFVISAGMLVTLHARARNASKSPASPRPTYPVLASAA